MDAAPEVSNPTVPREGGGCCSPGGRDESPSVVTCGVEHAAAESPAPPRAELLDGLIALPGGAFLMGSDAPDGFPLDGEGPVREITLRPFRIDRAPVTNARFAAFVAQTGHRTEAERFGWSFVFHTHIDPRRFEQVVADTVAAAPWWCKVPGARWNQPEGPGSGVERRGNFPAVHLSWNDAQAYAAWAGLRLPTEAEWEYAGRGGLVQKTFPWGNKLRPDGVHRCNIWQGDFPSRDTAEDGYAGTCPVDAFPPNGFGLLSVAGNTWEWCADRFSATDHARSDAPRHNPAGPPEGGSRVMKGGSFLCHKSYCNRYRMGARTANTPDSSASNIGFRCAL